MTKKKTIPAWFGRVDEFIAACSAKQIAVQALSVTGDANGPLGPCRVLLDMHVVCLVDQVPIPKPNTRFQGVACLDEHGIEWVRWD